jgi:hypothetical protein
VDDQRSHPGTINIDLRMLRYAQNFTVKQSPSPLGPHGAEIRTGDHVAISRLDIRDGKILLTQEFTEGNFYSASAVAIGVVGRESKPSYYNELTVRLSAEPRRGKVLILTAAAVSYDRNENVGDLALKQLAAAQGKSFDDLLQDNRNWWGHFWSRRFHSFAQRRRRGGQRREVLHLFPLPHGLLFPRNLHAALLRRALGHRRRFAHVGFDVLVAQPGLPLRRFHARQPA